jgi:hypothetical protein
LIPISNFATTGMEIVYMFGTSLCDSFSLCELKISDRVAIGSPCRGKELRIDAKW